MGLPFRSSPSKLGPQVRIVRRAPVSTISVFPCRVDSGFDSRAFLCVQWVKADIAPRPHSTPRHAAFARSLNLTDVFVDDALLSCVSVDGRERSLLAAQRELARVPEVQTKFVRAAYRHRDRKCSSSAGARHRCRQWPRLCLLSCFASQRSRAASSALFGPGPIAR